jgi:hypothetical protein
VPHCRRCIFAVIIIATVPLGGCNSGQNRPAVIAKAPMAMIIDVQISQQELLQVGDSLRELCQASDGSDLASLYSILKLHSERFGKELDEVRTGSRSAILAGNDQSAAWHRHDDGITEPDGRNAATKRQANLRQAIGSLAASEDLLNKASDLYTGEMAQILKVLDVDLSQPGIQSMDAVIAKLEEDRSNLRDCLDDVSDKSVAMNKVFDNAQDPRSLPVLGERAAER